MNSFSESMAEFLNSESGQNECNHYQNISHLSTNGVLRYIDNMLMEEGLMDADTDSILESSDFQAKERSFYEVLGQEYPQQAGLVTDEVCKFLHSKSNSNPNAAEGDHNYDTKDAVAVTRGKTKLPDPDREFDSWTYVDAGTCDKFAAYMTDLRNASYENSAQRTNRKEAVDLRSLLLSCAQSIASENHHGTNETLRQIRLHAYQFGDVNQRVAYYMVRGLEARIAGTGSSLHNALFIYDTMSASDYFTAYCTSLISSSFRRVSIFASNKLIAVRSNKFARVHIIDFGILYGFQWPAFIQRLSEREGGPPKLRITGVDFPQPGCEAAERIRTTGGRLVHYAEKFGVPFEYNAISQSWESIRVEDLGIEEGEFVAVNCLFRSENLVSDELLMTESPRSKFLDLIRKINPDMFVNAVVNGGYGLPYFITRFREALFHFSALFDMAETIIPKERPERVLLESILGNELMNVVACEGWERVARPETCSQWGLRHVRAGLRQVPLARKLLRSIVNKVRRCYHREFVVVEDNKWLMMSWKGRTICALACWKPAE